MAHPSRRNAAQRLARTADADQTFWDTEGIGAQANALRAWEWQATHCPRGGWAVVLEDDAQPVDGFTGQLHAALDAAPTPVVGLYLGKGTPEYIQPRVASAVARASDAHWIVGQRLHSAAGVAILGDLLGSVVTHLRGNQRRPVGEAISAWAVAHQHPVGCTWPSLVNHADIRSTIDRDRPERPRRAYRVGGRQRWTNDAVTL